MACNDISMELQLQRPPGIPQGHWLDVLIDACCQRTIPYLKSFSVGPDHGSMSMCIPGDGHGDCGRLGTFSAIAAVLAELNGVDQSRLERDCPMAAPTAATRREFVTSGAKTPLAAGGTPEPGTGF